MLHSKNSRYYGGSLKTPHTFGYFFTVTCTGIKPGRTTVTMYGVPGRLAGGWRVRDPEGDVPPRSTQGSGWRGGWRVRDPEGDVPPRSTQGSGWRGGWRVRDGVGTGSAIRGNQKPTFPLCAGAGCQWEVRQSFPPLSSKGESRNLLSPYTGRGRWDGETRQSFPPMRNPLRGRGPLAGSTGSGNGSGYRGTEANLV